MYQTSMRSAISSAILVFHLPRKHGALWRGRVDPCARVTATTRSHHEASAQIAELLKTAWRPDWTGTLSARVRKTNLNAKQPPALERVPIVFPDAPALKCLSKSRHAVSKARQFGDSPHECRVCGCSNSAHGSTRPRQSAAMLPRSEDEEISASNRQSASKIWYSRSA